MVGKNNESPCLNFVIEDNIIKGAEQEINITTTNIGKVILEAFDQQLTDVSQIEVETGNQTTFGEMKENSIRCAIWMKTQGVGTGDVVTVCTHNQLNAYIPCIGALLAGAIYNPWHHEIVLKTAQSLLNLTKPKLIFVCQSALNVLREAARLEGIETRFIVFETHPTIESLSDIVGLPSKEDVESFAIAEMEDPEAVAMILFSSGTTGTPKGVAHSYKTLLINIIKFVNLPNSNGINLWYSPLYWISGSFCMLQSILSGATRIIHATFDPLETCKVIEKYKVNWFFIAPTMVTRLAKSGVLKDFNFQSLKVLVTGGSKISHGILEEVTKNLPHTAVCQGYGMTEIGGIATLQTSKCKRLDSVGFVASDVKLKVIDVNTGDTLGPNQPGELCIASPTIMTGYYRNPAATKATIDEQGWVHTGDNGYYDEDGEFFIVDRLKEIMKFRGHHISPYEIEELLLNHPLVMEAAVVPVPHEIDLERPMAFVKKIPGSSVTENEIIEMTSNLGDDKKLWGGVTFVDEIPLTASGKINRKELKEIAKTYAR